MRLLLEVSILLIIGFVCGSELCKKNEWYDDLQGECRECTVCTGKLFRIAPCTSFMNTMCVDLKELSKPLWETIKAGHRSGTIFEKLNSVENPSTNSSGDQSVRPKEFIILADIEQPKIRPHENRNTIPFWARPGHKAAVSKNELDVEVTYDPWDVLLVTVLSIILAVLIVMIILTIMRNYCGIQVLPCGRQKSSHSKLVPRDRLNTTEYMKNLAGLDRRLAIDEILEKKKKAIFEPKLVAENIYTDEVFIDISGFPRNLNKSPSYEELDKKLLLEMDVKVQP